MQGYAAGEQIHDYASIATSWFAPVTGSATVLATQTAGGGTHDAVLATQTGGNNVHFATEGLLADNNMLAHALDWSAAPAQGPGMSLQMSRQAALFASRTDMDQAMEIADVNPEGGTDTDGIYDKLLPILTQWKDQFNFVGSYYIDIGNTTDQTTDWAKSTPYYKQMLALGNEIGSHSYTHPEDTNLLSADQIKFEFGDSRALIEQKLGITLAGAAVPGAPETLATARAIDDYYSYLSGGAALIGAGYPGALGYLSPSDTGSVYLAPDTSFDFTLVEFQKKTAEQASAAWAAEWSGLTKHADLPVIVWPWHDYGPTTWQIDPPTPSLYTTAMFTTFIQTAYNVGSEFVTLADLASRISSFEASSLSYSYDAAANTVTATVGSAAAGKFALDLDGGSKVKSVSGWYAYDDDSVFVGKTGGTYTMALGATPDDVTHITALPSRSELLSTSGDGTRLTFSVIGEGKVMVDLIDPAGRTPQVTGSSIVSLAGDKLELMLSGTGPHDVTVSFADRPPVLAAPIADQTATEGSAFSFSVPNGTFTDPDPGDVLSYTATRADGSALPSWLSFNASTRSFSGTPAAGSAGTLSILVTATDAAGAHVSESFDIAVAAGGLTLTGGAGNDTLTGGPGADTLNGAGGNDILDGLAGADSMTGGTGNDTFLVDNVGDQVIEAASGGTDTVRTTLASYVLPANVETLVFIGSGAFAGTGNTLANSLTGGSGDDMLDGLAGADTMTGGAGNDTYVVERTTDVVIEAVGGGTDTFMSSVSLTLAGNVENLVLTGTTNLNGTGNALDNQITGNAGANTLDGGAGADTLVGGAGNDAYVVDNASDLATEKAGEGTDTIRTVLASFALLSGNVENLTFTGTGPFVGTGNELLNTITGGAGNDTLDGGVDTLADRLVGGLGDDIYILRAGDVATEAAGAGHDVVRTDLLTITLGANIDDLVFTGTGAFRGTGNALNNLIVGGSGNDVINGGAGADKMNGGDGDDSYTVDNAGDIVIDSSGSDLITATGTLTAYTLQTGVEKLTYSGTAAFTATGNASDNTITTGAGNDTIRAGAGNDVVTSGNGDDRLLGEAGNDTLNGGAGADQLEGALGNDILTGGAGADRFVFDAPTGASTDRVVDFSVSQADKLAVYGSDYGLAAGALNVDWFETVAAGGTGTKGHAEFVYNTALRTLFWDSDGVGSEAAVKLATFDTAVTLHSTDFLIL
jgi:Ca2+-binding RTX toxin-like protein